MHLRIRAGLLILMLMAASFRTGESFSALPVYASVNDEPEPAPILERKLDFYEFNFKTADGRAFNLRDYASDRRIVIVGFVAGWCPNSNRNGHVLKRLYDKYHGRGLGVVVVTEYSDADEVRIHINRIGIDYPVVTETRSRGDRKASMHYKYRKAVGDKRKWGTPFYMIFESRDIEKASPKEPMARRVFTVSGEIIETEAEAFIEQRLSNPPPQP
ncbi:MAG TPA: redoxin family protein [Blastocatellia bacterium]|nr:redoxin family protein [Blastocatellia bacterium]